MSSLTINLPKKLFSFTGFACFGANKRHVISYYSRAYCSLFVFLYKSSSGIRFSSSYLKVVQFGDVSLLLRKN